MGSQQIWMFERAKERLVVRRRNEEDAFAVEIETPDGESRLHRFHDEDKFEEFQHDLQYMLVHSGWTLMEFVPDRRQGRDRRTFPRKADERRRWWTDGLRTPTTKTTRRGKRKPTPRPH